MQRAPVAVIAVALALLALPAPAAGQAPIRECGNYDGERWTHAPIQGAGIFNVTSRRVSCRRARRIVLGSLRSCRRFPCTYRRFRCRALEEGYEYLDVRCTRTGGRVVRFQTGA